MGIVTPHGSSLPSFDAYRAALRVSRLTTLCAVILGLTTITLACLVVTLLPLKTVAPMLVTFKDKGEQIVRIEPLEHNVQGLQQLQETLARQYVTLRETFDLQTEQERWRHMALLSAEALSQTFQQLMNPSHHDSPYKKRLTEGTTRSVKIIASASLAPSAPNVYQVEWLAEDYHHGQRLSQTRWLSTLTVSLEERAFDYNDQFINPLGFTVTHYTVAPKG